MILILLGPPGVGKGTQAEKIAQYLNVPTISTGALFRDAVSRGTELGKILKGYMDRGEYVPDDVVIQVIKVRTCEADCADGFLLDGFPRTAPQAAALEAFLAETNRTLDGAIDFEAPAELLAGRFTGRRVCPNDGATYHVVSKPPVTAGVCDTCGAPLALRPDDNPDVVTRRLEIYAEKTKPLQDYYRGKGLLHEILADGNPDEVFERSLAALKTIA